MSKQIAIAAAAAAGAYLVLGGKDEKQERYFIVNGVSVPESKLPQLGYTKVDDEWWPNATIQQAAQQGNVSIPNQQQGSSQQSDVTWAVIGGILATGMQMIPLFQDLGKNNKAA
jgi:hypothetical protein